MRHHHNLGFRHQLTTEMGYLVPIGTQEVLPGDTFRWKTSILARVAPLVNPLMHQVELKTSAWFVPNRILWDEWEDFITGDETKIKPTVVATNNEETWLMDHMGCAPAQLVDIDALPIRAYNMVWNEFFRDIDLQNEVAEDDMLLKRVNWERDYFTGARPAPQEGDAVSIPLSGNGRVNFSQQLTAGALTVRADSGSHPTQYMVANDGSKDASVYANLSSGGIDINEFRRAMALQRFSEARMAFGDRYVDYLRYLGVNPADGRLSRPEHLGSSSQVLSFSEVLATAEGSTTNVGDMAGHGIVGLSSKPWRKMFEEHGWVLVLAYVRPRTQYADGIPREFSRNDPMDYWQKELEILPWQDIKETEIWASGDGTATWGWTPRYAEYRRNISFVSGEMRAGGLMDDWHMARQFSQKPVLNASFVECTPTDRIYADKSIPEITMSTVHDVSAKRFVGESKIGDL